MKKGKIKNKYFVNNSDYFNFINKEKDNIKIIKVTYVIIK